MVEVLPNPRAEEEFDDYIIRSGGNPVGAEVAEEWEFSGAGQGLLTVLGARVDGLWGNVWAEGDDVASSAANAYLASAAWASQSPQERPCGQSVAEDIRGSIGAGYSVSEAARASCDIGLVKTATNLRNRDEVRDFLAHGYASFGAYAWLGYDDRPVTKGVHGQALVLTVGADGFRRWFLSDVIGRSVAVSTVIGWPGRG